MSTTALQNQALLNSLVVDPVERGGRALRDVGERNLQTQRFEQGIRLQLREEDREVQKDERDKLNELDLLDKRNAAALVQAEKLNTLNTQSSLTRLEKEFDFKRQQAEIDRGIRKTDREALRAETQVAINEDAEVLAEAMAQRERVLKSTPPQLVQQAEDAAELIVREQLNIPETLSDEDFAELLRLNAEGKIDELNERLTALNVPTTPEQLSQFEALVRREMPAQQEKIFGARGSQFGEVLRQANERIAFLLRRNEARLQKDPALRIPNSFARAQEILGQSSPGTDALPRPEVTGTAEAAADLVFGTAAQTGAGVARQPTPAVGATEDERLSALTSSREAIKGVEIPEDPSGERIRNLLGGVPVISPLIQGVAGIFEDPIEERQRLTRERSEEDTFASGSSQAGRQIALDLRNGINQASGPQDARIRQQLMREAWQKIRTNQFAITGFIESLTGILSAGEMTAIGDTSEIENPFSDADMQSLFEIIRRSPPIGFSSEDIAALPAESRDAVRGFFTQANEATQALDAI